MLIRWNHPIERMQGSQNGAWRVWVRTQRWMGTVYYCHTKYEILILNYVMLARKLRRFSWNHPIASAILPSNVLNRDPIRLFLSAAPCNWSHAINWGHAASAWSNVLRKQVRPKLCRPAIWPRLCRKRDAPLHENKYNKYVSTQQQLIKSICIIIVHNFHALILCDDKPEGPQNTNAAATTAVTPAATNTFSPSMSLN